MGGRNAEYAGKRIAELQRYGDISPLPITVATPEELAERTTILRDYVKGVKGLLFSRPDGVIYEKVVSKYEREDVVYPTFLEAVPKFIGLSRAVARVTAEAAGGPFDVVLNPASGTDLIGGTAFCQAPGVNHLVTYDNKDLYRWGQKFDEVADRDFVRRILTERIDAGRFDGEDKENRRRLTGYALDFALLAVNPDTIEVVNEQIIDRGEDQARITITEVKFKLPPGGKEVYHTNISGITFQTNSWGAYNRLAMDEAKQRGRIVQQKTLEAIREGDRVLLLRRAAAYGSGTTAEFYPLLPDGAVVVSDIGGAVSKSEMRNFVALGLPGIRLVNLVNSDVMANLVAIGRNAAYAKQEYPRFRQGYADLEDLSIYRVERDALQE